MNKFLNTIKEKLGLSEEDIKTKLSIEKEELSDKILRQKLGVYSLFTTKEEHQNYILNKLDNKQKEIDSLKEVETNFNSINKNYLLLNSKFEELVKNEWKNISTDNLPNLNLVEIDFNNLKQSLLKIADNNNLKIIDNKPTIDDLTNQKTNQEVTKIIQELVF